MPGASEAKPMTNDEEIQEVPEIQESSREDVIERSEDVYERCADVYMRAFDAGYMPIDIDMFAEEALDPQWWTEGDKKFAKDVFGLDWSDVAKTSSRKDLGAIRDLVVFNGMQKGNQGFLKYFDDDEKQSYYDFPIVKTELEWEKGLTIGESLAARKMAENFIDPNIGDEQRGEIMSAIVSEMKAQNSAETILDDYWGDGIEARAKIVKGVLGQEKMQDYASSLRDYYIKSMDLDVTGAKFASPEARAIADVVLDEQQRETLQRQVDMKLFSGHINSLEEAAIATEYCLYRIASGDNPNLKMPKAFVYMDQISFGDEGFYEPVEANTAPQTPDIAKTFTHYLEKSKNTITAYPILLRSSIYNCENISDTCEAIAPELKIIGKCQDMGASINLLQAFADKIAKNDGRTLEEIRGDVTVDFFDGIMNKEENFDDAEIEMDCFILSAMENEQPAKYSSENYTVRMHNIAEYRFDVADDIDPEFQLNALLHLDYEKLVQNAHPTTGIAGMLEKVMAYEGESRERVVYFLTHNLYNRSPIVDFGWMSLGVRYDILSNNGLAAQKIITYRAYNLLDNDDIGLPIDYSGLSETENDNITRITNADNRIKSLLIKCLKNRGLNIKEPIGIDDDKLVKIADFIESSESEAYDLDMIYENCLLLEDDGKPGEAFKVAAFGVGRGDKSIFAHGLNESNIIEALALFMYEDAEDWQDANHEGINYADFGLDDLDFGSRMKDGILAVREAFSATETKNLAMREISKLYREYLKNPEEDPKVLRSLCEVMRRNEGAGPLTQIEGMLNFFTEIIGQDEKTIGLAKKIEERMRLEKWDDKSRSEFFDVSAEILHADPEFYNAFAEIFTNGTLEKGEFEQFAKDLYPLFKAELVLQCEFENYDDDGIGGGYTVRSYENVDKEAIKERLREMLRSFNFENGSTEQNNERKAKALEHVRGKMLEDLTGIFQEKFHIRSEVLPEKYSDNDMRAISDMALYLSNIADADEKKKAIIGFYLALQLGDNDNWSKFRSGEIKSAAGFIDDSTAAEIDEYIAEGEQYSPFSIIESERTDEIRAATQAETVNIRTGNIFTIDRRLQTIIGNIEDLEDPDLYENPMDKAKIEVLRKYRENPRKINTVAAKLWGMADGKDIDLSEDEQDIAEDMLDILNSNNIEVTKDSIKQHLQLGLKALSAPFTLRQTINEAGVTETINELQAMLQPSGDVKRIFDSMGENITPNSGVLALGSDIDYLENLVRKNEKKISAEDKAIVNEYLAKLRSKLTQLEKSYDKVVNSIKQMKTSSETQGAGMGMKSKIGELERIINRGNEESVIATTCTTELPKIIENMRACLSAKTRGCNNDTDLTFGEPYKFYVYSSGNQKGKGSIADQIVHLIQIEDESSNGPRLTFMLDRVYGERTKDIFYSHVATIVKKAQNLRAQYPEAEISIFIPEATQASCQVSGSKASIREQLSKSGVEVDGLKIEEKSVRSNSPHSGFAVHYVEWDDTCASRYDGDRELTAKGYEISL